jgi:hypothetical protein
MATEKRKNRNGAGRREKTILNKGYELGKFPGYDVAIIIRKRDRYSTFISTKKDSFPPTMEEIVRESTISLMYLTNVYCIETFVACP